MVKLGALSLKGPKGRREFLGGGRHRADKDKDGGNGQGRGFWKRAPLGQGFKLCLLITQTAGAGPPTTLLPHSCVVDPSPACLPALD